MRFKQDSLIFMIDSNDSPAEIEAVKAKRATKSYRELAAEYGIDERALWRLVNGRARHVLSLHQ